MTLTEVALAPTHLGPESNGMLLTPAEYDAASDWEPGHRYELVNGVLVVLPPPGFGERSPNDYLGHLLYEYAESQATAGAFNATAPEQTIQCGENRRRADRAIWIGYGEGFDPDKETPTIAVEFVSETARDRRRDYVDKRAEYAAAGVEEYWVIDRYERTMTVFIGEQVQTVHESDVYETPRLPGFALPLAKLIEKATA